MANRSLQSPLPLLGRTLAALLFLAASSLWAQSVQELKLIVGKSVVIDYPADIGRISTSNPEVVDYVAVTTREILLHAKSHGNATLVVWSKTGQREFYNINVEHNLEPIRKLLKATFPNEDIQVQAARDTVTLNGTVPSKEVMDRAIAAATPLAKTVVNNLKLPPAKVDRQIMLRVKFAELNRNAAQSFGFNLVSTGALGTIGRITPGGTAAPVPSQIAGANSGANTSSRFTLTDALNVFAFRPDINLAAVIQALQQQGVLQILAEPNLVTTNGKEASFLVGGEFPVPILQGGANAGAVTVQFREFGIRLTFNPVLTENKTIKMYVRPEVNTIDLANSVSIAGFNIPALATRRIETNVELGEGQSFIIGGLIDDRVSETMSRIPGLSSVPLLGNLFRSRALNRSKNELVVLVTPEITTPIDVNEPRPQFSFPYEFMSRDKPMSDRPNASVQNLPESQVHKGKTLVPFTPGSKSADGTSAGSAAPKTAQPGTGTPISSNVPGKDQASTSADGGTATQTASNAGTPLSATSVTDANTLASNSAAVPVATPHPGASGSDGSHPVGQKLTASPATLVSENAAAKRSGKFRNPFRFGGGKKTN